MVMTLLKPTCISCGEDTSSEVQATIGEKNGPVCTDCAFWCDGNITKAPDFAEIAARLERGINECYGQTTVQLAGGSFGHSRIFREALIDAAREGYRSAVTR